MQKPLNVLETKEYNLTYAKKSKIREENSKLLSFKEKKKM